MKTFLVAIGGIVLWLLVLFNFVMGLKNHDAYYLVLSIIYTHIANNWAERMEL